MNQVSIDAVATQSARLKTAFGWVFGIGTALLFTQVMYVPLKTILFAIGTFELATAAQNLGLLLLQCLPAITLLAAIHTARNLFSSYAQGAVLSARSAQLLGRVGDWLTVSAILALLVGPASATMDAVTGGFITTQIALVCVGVAIRLVGRVQGLAAQINADHQQIV